MTSPMHFNPRTRVGCDRPNKPGISSREHFNPRTRVGCDAACRAADVVTDFISIHAPGWGATHPFSTDYDTY